jgi:hypothetical protein
LKEFSKKSTEASLRYCTKTHNSDPETLLKSPEPKNSKINEKMEFFGPPAKELSRITHIKHFKNDKLDFTS